MDTRPIGMFDSGCGGLTVLSEYIKWMPNEDFIYIGDNANLPYGDKSKENIISYSKKIVEFLINQNVKMVVIACGTASAAAYETLKSIYSIPIRTVITPVAQKIEEKNIGIIATKSTIQSHTWENQIKKYHPEVSVTSVACPLLVPIIEEGFANTKISTLAVQSYLSAFQKTSIEALVLGCTHYPILKDCIQKEIGTSIKVIDISSYSAQDTLGFIEEKQLQNLTKKLPEYRFYTSDDPISFIEKAKLFLHMEIKQVDTF